MADYDLTLIFPSREGEESRTESVPMRITADTLHDAQVMAQIHINYVGSGFRTVQEAVLSNPEPPFYEVSRWRQAQGWVS